MKKLGEDLTLEEVQDMLKEADADGNGEIEFAGKMLCMMIMHVVNFEG